MKSHLFILLLLGPLFACDLSGQESQEPKHWDKVVAIQTKLKTSNKHATGFFIRKGGTFFIVTANHAADETKSDTRILYTRESGESRYMQLRGIVPSDTNPWTQYKNNDLAVARLQLSRASKSDIADFNYLALPYEALLTSTPPRASEIDFVGFPMAYGTTPPISSLVVRGHIASRELKSKGDWGVVPIIYATPTVAAGSSGSPVFRATQSPDAIAIVGMYIAVAVDETGAKLAKIVPARLIREAIDAAAGTLVASEAEKETKDEPADAAEPQEAGQQTD
ncbi:S1 family peptidase [Rosistilla oblonga]|uniref:S1 family peptidase n=1 Tax=Rosistilla oblonga TaxID=2527990 RepID=UPI003A980CFB